MGDVLEYLIDGTSGLAPGGVDGKAICAGVCSKGQVGKAYLIGKRTDLADMLGTGPLVDCVRDMLATGGQNPVLVAVPVAGQPGGYITPPRRAGVEAPNAPEARISGTPQNNADIRVQVMTAGQVGVATVRVSYDNGKSWGSSESSSSAMVLGQGEAATGATLLLPEDAQLDEGMEYALTVRLPIGPVLLTGEASPLLLVAGAVTAAAELVVQIVKPGKRNEGTFQLSIDGGDNFARIRTIPADGVLDLPDMGVHITFPAGQYAGGAVYTCRLLAPAPSIVDVMAALETPLNLYDVEFVAIAGPSDAVDWAAAQARSEELWNLHRPTFFKMATRLPYDGEDLNDYTADMLAQRQQVAGRFVQVCCQFGEISDTGGTRKLRNWLGLQAGRAMSIPVQRATGRVKDGPVSQGALPEGWEAVQTVLEDAGFVTAKKYAGLQGAYWGDSRTLAEDTSDYRYEEVLRVVFKAVRLSRIAALKSMYDEAGDPLYPEQGGGLEYLKANVENALGTMVAAIPKEMAGYVVDIPPGQDIANNGVAVEIALIGIPIIRQIKLFFRYVYAGSRFDPRMKQAA